jgi:hypothetical protein
MPLMDPAQRAFLLIDALPALGDQPSAAQLQALKAMVPAAVANRPVTHRAGLESAFGRIAFPDQALAHVLGLPAANLRALAVERQHAVGENHIVARLAHWHAARDHVVLHDLEPLAGLVQHPLVDAIRPAFAHAGWAIGAIESAHGTNGLILAPPADYQPSDLSCSASRMALGRNIDLYLPRGSRARDWRRLHNEAQMIWFDHPLNQQRAHQGLAPVNAIWLEGWTPHPWHSAVGPWPSLWTTDDSWRAAWPGPLASRRDAQLVAHQAPADPLQLAAWWNELAGELATADGDRLVMTGPDRWIALGPLAKSRAWIPRWLRAGSRARDAGLDKW